MRLATAGLSTGGGSLTCKLIGYSAASFAGVSTICVIARMLSKLGRGTGKGNRWTQSRVATRRRKHRIAPPDPAQLNPDLLNLAQATSYSGISDTTLLRLIKADILAAEQIAPYAPLEVKRSDLDSEPVQRIVKHLKATGKLLLDGEPPVEQRSLF